ncbi:MAG: hypothetical protein R3199_04480 [Gemmatimonadota bacterium]|nr:hypothetical protein [Gemmatimonadota bacterium]
MTRLPAAFLFLILAAAPASAQTPGVPEGGSLLAWMGLEPGESLVYEIDGRRICVTVDEPLEIRGRRYAPLRGLEWPGMASDSRILVPLDGALELSTIATPGFRPHPRPLLSRPDSALAWAVDLESLQPAVESRWTAVGGERDDPRFLVHTWCAACMDAGTRVVLERGGGIRTVSRTTITGTTTLRRVDDVMCADKPEDETVDVEVYVLPEKGREP